MVVVVADVAVADVVVYVVVAADIVNVIFGAHVLISNTFVMGLFVVFLKFFKPN